MSNLPAQVSSFIGRGAELAGPTLWRPGVSEVAARYQFADGSHFIRAFKAHYGQTPVEFARTPRGEAGAGTDSTGRSDK
jgi:AraC-like DNA-binding protein